MTGTFGLDAQTTAALHAGWLSRALEPAGEYGRRAFARMRPFAPGEEPQAQQRAAEIASIARDMDAARLDAVLHVVRATPDVASIVARCSAGDVLDDAAFLELLRFCDGIAQARTLAAASPAITPLSETATRALAAALERGRAGKHGFYLHDRFDASLARERAEAARAQAAYDAQRARLSETIGKALRRDDVSDGEFIVMRADLAGGLPAGVRVVREAPTYLLCEIELDDVALAALRERDAATHAAAHAEERVRAALSHEVRERARDIDGACDWLGALDVRVTAARFARIHACEPAYVVTEPIVRCENARFLPMAERLEREGRAYVPIALDVRDCVVLTGPNMGGKSVALQTCGFVAMCAAWGLPVPAQRARVGLFGAIEWLGVGTDARPGGLLSSFATEVVRLRGVLADDAPRKLVLMDEFARTTTPHEGRALLIAVIAALRLRGATAFIATHLADVARPAGARHVAVRGLRGIPQRSPAADLAASLAALGASMDYTLADVTESDGAQSDALALAALLGLDDTLIARAYEALKATS